jgi:hypothetical protein
LLVYEFSNSRDKDVFKFVIIHISILREIKMNKDVIIEKYNYGFRINLSEKESYFLKDHEGKYCVIDIENNREIKDISYSDYEDFGVKNLDELFCILTKNPKEVLEMITGDNIQIEKVIIEYHEN